MHAIYPGSFDPITNGHLDILDRSLKVFSEVTLLVAQAPDKKNLIPARERVQLIEEVLSSRKNIRVDLWSGLIMDYAKKHSIKAVVRGLRAASDFEYEFMMASTNQKIYPDVETVFMMSSPNLYFVSSSMVKELFTHGGDISAYVPLQVKQALERAKP